MNGLVAPVSVTFPKLAEGAPGPSLLGTGDGKLTFHCPRIQIGVPLWCMNGERGWQLPEWMRYRQFGYSSPVPKGEGPGAPST
jgi:hypothetical protein